MIRTLTLVALFLAMATPAAVAQAPVDPLVDHVEDKRAAAEDDPAGFVGEQASPEGLAEEKDWTIAYGCYLVDAAGDETPVHEPDLEPCHGYEDVIGTEEEPEAPAAEAEPLEDDPVEDAEDLVADTVGTAQAIADDPAEAPNQLVAFLDRLVAFVEDVLDRLGGAFGDVAAANGETLAAFVSVAGVGAGSMREATDAVGDGVASAAGAVSGAAGELWRNLASLLTGGPDSSSLGEGQPRPAPPESDVLELPDILGDVACVECLTE